MRNGMREGRGTITWPDGSMYVGQWQNDRKHGRGIQTEVDGSQYDGMFQNGYKHGMGATIEDGVRQKGKWINDVFQDPNPKKLKSKEDQKEEEGSIIELSDSVYVGKSQWKMLKHFALKDNYAQQEFYVSSH